MMKINDCYEFFDIFDVVFFFIEDVDKFELWIYQLYGVFVYSGDFNVGYYYVFFKFGKEGWFYKYDDDKVIKVIMWEVLEENFGGEFCIFNGYLWIVMQKKVLIICQNSVYMLVYI